MLTRINSNDIGPDRPVMPALTRALVYAAVFMIALLAFALNAQAQKDPNDPGAIDFVHVNLHDWDLSVGGSAPLRTELAVDNPIQGLDLWLEIKSLDTGAIHFDSVHFRTELQHSCLVNNPDMIPNRIVTHYCDGILPDTVNIFMYGVGPGEIYECATIDSWDMYYTGLHAGRVLIHGIGGDYGPNQQTRFWVGGNPVDGDGDHYGRVYSTAVDVGGGTQPGGGGGDATDPGNVDVVLVNSDPADYHWEVGLNQSSPVGVTFMWDEPLKKVELTLEVNSATTGLVRADSVAFINLLLDPTILPDRVVSVASDGIFPDTITVVASASSSAGYLYPAQSPDIRTLFYIYLTGLQAGDVSLAAFDGETDPVHATKFWPDGQTDWFGPVVQSFAVPVVDGGGINFTDPGVRDTLAVEGLVLYTGLSVPINVRVVNDEEIRHFTSIFQIETVDSASARIDSVVWKGRFKDTWTCSDRSINQSAFTVGRIEVGANTVHLDGYSHPLPVDDEVVYQIWLTALTPGTIRVDTASVMFSTDLRHTKSTFELMDEQTQISPYFTPLLIRASSDQPPEFTAPMTPPDPSVCGQYVMFTVDAESNPPGNNVALGLLSLTGWDDNDLTPSINPDFNPTNGLFTWSSSSSDVGIWRALFVATEVATGAADTMSVMASVVSDPGFLVPYSIASGQVDLAPSAMAVSIAHGNFDADQQLEVAVTPYLSPEPLVSLTIHEYYPMTAFTEVNREAYGNASFNRGLKAGYFNSDQILDLVMIVENQLYVLYGNGDRTFQPSGVTRVVPGPHSTKVALANFNNDAYLDYLVLGGSSLYIFPGMQGGFSSAITIDLGLTNAELYGFNGADFDRDGWDDLAIGSPTGITILINDQSGGFEAGPVYNLDYPPIDIAVTSDGADFNGDGYYDLCVAVPLNNVYWYTDATTILILLGNGDGTFSALEVGTIQGLVRGCRPGDFNSDGHLDIAFTNFNERYLGLLFGDGTGAFPNQIRKSTPGIEPFSLDCLDIDVDGDMDILVSGTDGMYFTAEHWHHLFVNGIDPSGIMNSGFSLTVKNDATVELVAPNGGRLSPVENSIASAELYPRSIDDNSSLDAIATVGAVQSGQHAIVVKPKAGASGDDRFSLSYRVSGCTYHIARNLPAPAQEYVFPLYPGGTSSVKPAQGGGVRNEHPVLEWDPADDPLIDFQSSLPFADAPRELRIATDPDFENIIESNTATGSSYTMQTSVIVQDSTSYFWQMRFVGQSDWGGIYTFNALPLNQNDKDPADVDNYSGLGNGEDRPTGGGSGGDGINADSTAQADATGDEAQPDDAPLAFGLLQNQPNPFNPATEIAYNLEHSGQVRLEVFNVLGNLVTTLVDEYQGAGSYVVTWDAARFASGIYLYRLSTDEFSATKKMILVK